MIMKNEKLKNEIENIINNHIGWGVYDDEFVKEIYDLVENKVDAAVEKAYDHGVYDGIFNISQ